MATILYRVLSRAICLYLTGSCVGPFLYGTMMLASGHEAGMSLCRFMLQTAYKNLLTGSGVMWNRYLLVESLSRAFAGLQELRYEVKVFHVLSVSGSGAAGVVGEHWIGLFKEVSGGVLVRGKLQGGT